MLTVLLLEVDSRAFATQTAIARDSALLLNRQPRQESGHLFVSRGWALSTRSRHWAEPQAAIEIDGS
jgi:hypothetical protein